MEATEASPSQITPSPTHPLLLAAAASVTALSLAGVGVLAGWLPGPTARNAEAARPAAAPISIQQTVSVPQEKARLAPSASQRAPVSIRRVAATPVGAPLPPIALAPPPTYAASSPEPVYRVATPPPAVCNDCGVVEAVREVAVEPRGSGGGAVAGGLVGGIIGNQWGRGATRDIATLLGAAGGAYAGNHIEKSIKESRRYDVIVRFDDGNTRSFSSETVPAWHSGDRVMLQNGLLIRGGGRSNGGLGTI